MKYSMRYSNDLRQKAMDLHFNQKKVKLLKERNQDRRKQFKERVRQLQQEGHILIYQDECGIEEDLIRVRGRQVRGIRLYGETVGTKHSRTSVISGYTKLPDRSKYLYISPFMFKGYCNTSVFNFWIEALLIHELIKLKEVYQKPITLILDNVTYHKSLLTIFLLEKHQINLFFQPPYSPDLNKIEPSWTHTKDTIRSLSYEIGTSFEDKLVRSIKEKTW